MERGERWLQAQGASPDDNDGEEEEEEDADYDDNTEHNDDDADDDDGFHFRGFTPVPGSMSSAMS